MIETVGLLTNRDKYLKQNSWIAVLLYGVLCVGALGFLLSWGHVTASIPEAPVGGGRCRDQITCPGTVIFPMCQRSKLDEGSGQNLPTSEPCRITAELCTAVQCFVWQCCINRSGIGARISLKHIFYNDLGCGGCMGRIQG